MECRAHRTVGKFEEAFQSDLNLKVKVYTKDNWVKVLDGITLAAAAELPTGMTKAKMEEYLSYQREERDVTPNEDNSVSISPEELNLRKEFLEDGYDVAVRLHKISDISSLSTIEDINDRIFIARIVDDDYDYVGKEAYQYTDSAEELVERIMKFKNSQARLFEFRKRETPPLELYYFRPDEMVGTDVLTDVNGDIFIPQKYWEIYQGEDEDEEWPDRDTSFDEQIVHAINLENDFTMGWSVKFFINTEIIDMIDVCI